LPAAALAALLFDEPGLLRRQQAATVYVREPAALPRDLQARLCVWLDAAHAEGAPRLLAGCRGDPRADVAAGRLLEALHCGLSTLTSAVPPLRERLADLGWLCDRMLQRAADGAGTPATLTAAALDVLRAHRWPGNLRELFNVLADAAARAGDRAIEPGDLPWYLRPVAPGTERTLPLDSILEQVERRLLRLALDVAKQNRTRAAELLAIWRPRLIRRLEALGLSAGKASPEGTDDGTGQGPPS
jgi:DNA-binding NtrC family response regulator